MSQHCSKQIQPLVLKLHGAHNFCFARFALKICTEWLDRYRKRRILALHHPSIISPPPVTIFTKTKQWKSKYYNFNIMKYINFRFWTPNVVWAVFRRPKHSRGPGLTLTWVVWVPDLRFWEFAFPFPQPKKNTATKMRILEIVKMRTRAGHIEVEPDPPEW